MNAKAIKAHLDQGQQADLLLDPAAASPAARSTSPPVQIVRMS